MYPCADLGEVVKILQPLSVCVGVLDVPLWPNIIAVEKNTPVRRTFRERYWYFLVRGGDLLPKSVAINQQRRERMTFRSLNDFESDSDMAL
jgi:hypothetical protein